MSRTFPISDAHENESTATHGAEDSSHGRDPMNRQGFSWGKWRNMIIAVDRIAPNEFDVQLTLTNLHESKDYPSSIVTVVVNGPAVQFDLPNVPAVGGGDAHIMGVITREGTGKPLFTVNSTNIDTIWLLGARNIALNDMQDLLKSGRSQC